jgi:hypothetical protein
MLLVNVGPSALALGLLIPMALDAGINVCVIGRPGEPPSPTVFRLSISGPGGRLEYREVQWWEGAASVDDLPEDLLERIASDEPLLMTGSLRAAIVERYEFMIEVLERRPAIAETLVLACENAPHSYYEKVRDACEQRGALMLRTVVNRMCVELESSAEAEPDERRLVSAHRLCEWLVESPPEGATHTLLDALGHVKGFDVVDDIDARYDRKLWMVNGAHQALALFARRAQADHRLEDGLLADGDDLRTHLTARVLASLGHLHAVMNEALRVVHPSLRDSMQYSLEHVVAYSEHPDSVSRVLGAFRRLDLVPFIDALDQRIAAPARICHEQGISVEPFRTVIDVFVELVASIDSFADNIEVRRTTIDPSTDRLAVDRLREMLTPWAGEDSEKLVAHFAQLLADHSEAFESL